VARCAHYSDSGNSASANPCSYGLHLRLYEQQDCDDIRILWRRSRVEGTAGVFNDAFRNLKLSIGDGASQTDAVATLRPVERTEIVLEGGRETDFNATD